MDSRFALRSKISPDDHGPYIVITSYILMSIMVLCTIARLGHHRYKFAEIPRLDEFLLLAAMVSDVREKSIYQSLLIKYRLHLQLVAIAENIVIHQAVQDGLGKRQSGLSANSLVLYDKVTESF